MLQIYDVEVPREIYSSTDHGRFISFSVTDRKNVVHCAYESFGMEQMSSTIQPSSLRNASLIQPPDQR